MKVVFDLDDQKLKSFLEGLINKIKDLKFDEPIINEKDIVVVFTDKGNNYTLINENDFLFSSSSFSLEKRIVIKIFYEDDFKNLKNLESNLLDIYYPALFVDLKDPIKTMLQIKNVFVLCRNFMMGNFNEIRQLQEKIKILDNQIIVASKNLSEILEEMIMRLGKAVEAKDHYTGNHVKRVANYCKTIAQYLKLPSNFIKNIYLSSPLHDIGKVGIPDNILLKPSTLSKEEFEIIKKHTIIGQQILANSKHEVIQMAEVIAFSHHEKYNGTGYPLGLKGEDIPLEARIVAISDVFDALTSRRPYKEPWPIEEAVKEIKKGASVHFDPEIVNAFIKSLREITEIKHSLE